jgi:ATP-dependent helicase HrpA
VTCAIRLFFRDDDMSSTSIGIQELRDALPTVMGSDRFRLAARLRRIAGHARAGFAVERRLEQLARQIARSQQLRTERLESVPDVRFDNDLPIHAQRDAIAEAIQQHPVVIVAGQTGSGKSTQLPKICLQAGRGIDGIIGHTQPRRLAARNIANRLAEQLRVPLGQQVGYQVRFTDITSPTTLIKVMTDGILLADTQRDRFLERYDTIILDEAHERSLNIDFLLGYLHRLLRRRDNLRLIVTSATLDAQRFQSHFSTLGPPVPLIEIPGRTYPVEVRYRPLRGDGETAEPELARAIQESVAELIAAGPGDILVFLPTERDIREVAQSLRGWSVAARRSAELEILPLYARLSAAEQQRIYQSSPRRRIVLATNVAESSLTVPGIRYVIDTGTARLGRYSPRAKVQQLPIEPISQASAQQRAGRCGRLGPGICLRLYDEEDFENRPPYTTPEIRRTNLASVILQTKALGLGTVEQFPFLDPPRPDALREGYQTLVELGAIDDRHELTPIGRTLSRLPLDPRLARMIVAAQQENCLHEMLIIAAALEVQDPRERPVDRRGEVDAAHRAFTDESSDFMTYLRLWDFFHQLRTNQPRRQWSRLYSHFYLSPHRLREWSEMVRQLKRLVEQNGWRLQARKDDYGAIHRALLAGLLSGVAYRRSRYEYQGAHGARLFLWPGSSPFAKRPAWIVAAEALETSRRYARTVAQIDPAWIEPLAEHLVQRRHGTPTWSRKRGMALCQEKVSLFGMPIVTSRSIPLSNVDSAAAREIFIRQALVAGNCSANFHFQDHNQRVLQEALELAGKLRRSDWFLAEEAQFRFYDERLPLRIHDLSRLRQWLPQAERRDPALLRMELTELLPHDADTVPPRHYPPELELDALRLPLQYRHEPGSARDGITATIPRIMLGQIKAEQFDWLVPGRLEEKVATLIRLLPKPIRRCLVPAPDTARAVVSELPFGEGPFLKRLARQLERRAEMPISAESLAVDQLPHHLRMNFRVVDEKGNVLGEGRDLGALTRQLSELPSASQAEDPFASWHRVGLRRWTFDELPEQLEMEWGGVQVRRYPTLLDRGTSVDVTLVDWKPDAQSRFRQGLRRLYVLTEKRELRAQLAWFPHMDAIRLLAERLPGGERIDDEILDLMADRAFMADAPLPRTFHEFERQCEWGRARIPAVVQELAQLIPSILQGHQSAREHWEEHQSPTWQHATQDIDAQLTALVQPGFLTETPYEWLQHYPRYFRGILYRFERLRSGALERDRMATQQLTPYRSSHEEVVAEHFDLQIADPELMVYRWMLEEFRISLFAQPLGTHVPVSIKRLDKQLGRIRR